jgi:hypothetical protein
MSSVKTASNPNQRWWIPNAQHQNKWIIINVGHTSRKGLVNVFGVAQQMGTTSYYASTFDVHYATSMCTCSNANC